MAKRLHKHQKGQLLKGSLAARAQAALNRAEILLCTTEEAAAIDAAREELRLETEAVEQGAAAILGQAQMLQQQLQLQAMAQPAAAPAVVVAAPAVRAGSVVVCCNAHAIHLACTSTQTCTCTHIYISACSGGCPCPSPHIYIAACSRHPRRRHPRTLQHQQLPALSTHGDQRGGAPPDGESLPGGGGRR